MLRCVSYVTRTIIRALCVAYKRGLFLCHQNVKDHPILLILGNHFPNSFLLYAIFRMTKSLHHKRALALSMYVLGSAKLAAAGPCDIYAAGGTPCVAAHATTRALYNNFSGALYQITRQGDQATKDILPLSAGGVADSGSQLSFCAGSTCLISIIYDQSGHGNHLTRAPQGGAAVGLAPGGNDFLASAGGAPVTLGGKEAFGVFSSPYTGYRNDATNGIATGTGAQGMYMVTDGTHFNERCCFDYGNAEVNNMDQGAGTMEAIYFGMGDGSGNGVGGGSGPWIMADLENGLFSGYNKQVNTGDTSMTSRFVTAIIKGEPGTWAIRGGDASQGALQTFYSGQRPAGYVMDKKGAIILGIGGDNSDGAQGTFYEGAMTSGYPSDATENSVQQNIVQAAYKTTSLTTGPALTSGSHISLRVTTACCNTRYIAHTGSTVNTQVVTGSSAQSLKQQASWIVHPGLGNSACWSFESVDSPGQYIRHSAWKLMVSANDGTKLMHEDATFCSLSAVSGNGNSFRSWSYPTHWIRHFNSLGYIANNGGPNAWDAQASFNDDVSFVVSSGFA